MNLKAKNLAWQFVADTYLTAWLERAGQRFDVFTDEDLHHEGAELAGRYRALITGTHPEYYSTAMLDALEGYLEGGGRLMYMGGNGFYWRIAYHPTRRGVIEVRRAENGTRAWAADPGEAHHAFTGEYGGLWRSLGRAPNRLVGVGFAAQGFDGTTYYRRTAASHDARAGFVFKGVEGEVIGDHGRFASASGQEIDRFDVRLGSPRHALVLASSENQPPGMLRTTEEFLMTVPLGNDPNVRSDLVFFECPNGGAVFSTGSIGWGAALAHDDYDNDVARVTRNVLERFLDPTPFQIPDDEPS
jgi:N,N-dimethylformamidase